MALGHATDIFLIGLINSARAPLSIAISASKSIDLVSGHVTQFPDMGAIDRGCRAKSTGAISGSHQQHVPCTHHIYLN